MAARYRSSSTLRRAVLPVLGGIAFFAVLGLILWGVAALLSDNPEDVAERLSATTFEVGDVDSMAAIIAEDGPLIFPDLVRSGGTRTVVLDHEGDNPTTGWRVFFAYPADRDLECKVTQVRRTRTFTDCDGRTLDVGLLAPAAGVIPVITDIVTIDLRGATSTTTTAP